MVSVARKFVSVVLAALLSVAFVPITGVGEQAQAASAQVQSTQEASISVPAEGAEYASDELLVTLDNQLSADTAAQQQKADAAEDEAAETLEVAGAEGTEVLAEASTAAGSVLKVDIDTGSTEASIVAAQEELAAQPGVVAVQPNYCYSLPESTTTDSATTDVAALATSSVDTGTNDTYASSQYYLGDSSSHGSNFVEAWNYVKCEGSVTVAVLDTGCYYEHEDLTANVDTTYMYDAVAGVTLGSSNDNPNGDIDTDGSHGTMTCGMISAVANNDTGTVGASYNATLLPIRVFEEDSSGDLGCSTSTLLQAYSYLFGLVDEGKVTNLHVVNMSLGGYTLTSEDKLFSQAMATARSTYNIVSVCAGGNGDGEKAYTYYSFPGDDDAAVSVTALTTKGTNATWSDYNEYKDISAPGEKIYSTSFKATTTHQTGPGGWIGWQGGWFGGGSGDTSSATYTATYSTEGGTSAASPIVASAFALLWAADPTLTADGACEAVYATATEVTGTPDRSATSGSHGALDAAAAVEYVLSNKVGTNADIINSSTTSSTSETDVVTSFKVGKATYKVTNASAAKVKLVSFTGSGTTAKIPAKVTYGGVTYKVVKLAAKSFKGSKATTVKLGMKSFTKASIKNCFKGSKVKKVKLASAALVKKYKSLFKNYSGKSSIKVTT